MASRELEAELAALSPAEKATLVQRLALEVANVWPGVEKTPSVAGGAACIVRTRIPVWSLESYRRLGWTDARILSNFPSLRAVDLAQAWAYVDGHRAEMDEEIRKNEAA
jgi:uncharacterized protein (DUF433 family)